MRFFKSRWHVLALAAITAGGCWLRYSALSSPSLWIDEGFSAVYALSILEHGYPLLPTGETSWNSFPVHYLMALGIRLFRDFQFGARFFSALFGTMMIPAFYFLNRQIFQSRIQSLLACLLLALMTYEIAWSRQARMYVYLQLFSLVTVACFYRFLEFRRRSDLVFTCFFIFMCAVTHRAWYVALMVIATSGLFELRNTRTWLRWIRHHVCFAITWLILSLGAAALLLFGPVINSNFVTSFSDFLADTHQNYSKAYLSFLNGQLNGLLIWVPVGALLAVWKRPRFSIPLVITVCAYFYVISTRNILFHFRYTLPLICFLLMFAAHAYSFLFERCFSSRSMLLKSGTVFLTILFLSCVSGARFQYLPARRYRLGFTAPQPDWRQAYKWIESSHGDGDGSDDPIVTVSNFPMFHDFYLGKSTGMKYFLPFSLSGYPNEFREKPQYSKARLICSLDELTQLDCHVVLDDFGLRMLKNKQIRDFLLRRQPDRRVCAPQGFDVFVWRLSADTHK